jgi:hypothetical protein
LYPPIATTLWHGFLGSLDRFFLTQYHSVNYLSILIGGLPIMVGMFIGIVVGTVMADWARHAALVRERGRRPNGTAEA